MKYLNTVDYKEQYAKMSDEELLTLAAQEPTLVDSARTALQGELRRRGLHNTSLDEYQGQIQRQSDTEIRERGPVVDGEWASVILPRGSFRFPPVCPSCLTSNADTYVSIRSEQETSRYRVIYRRVEWLVLAVPHCKSCARNFKRWQAIWRASILLGLLAAVAIAVKFDVNRWVAGLLAIALGGPGIWASMSLKRSVRFVGYDERWLYFRFKSLEYANQFHRLNSQG